MPPTLFCKQQRSACSLICLIQTRGIFFTLDATKHHDWGWMLGCWHSTVFRHIMLNLTIWSITLLKTGKNENWFPWFFRSFSNRCVTCAPLHTLLNHCTQQGFLIFPPIFLTILDTVKTEIFAFSASLAIFCHGSFLKAFFGDFLAYSLSVFWSKMTL